MKTETLLKKINKGLEEQPYLLMFYNPKENSYYPIERVLQGVYLGDGDFRIDETGNCIALLPGDNRTESEKIEDDTINPPYYKIPGGRNCIQITKHMNFCLGNVFKYIWRAGEKRSNSKLEDLKKALWYLEKQIELEESY